MRQLALERAAQVVDFFIVDEQVAVAGHAELVAAEDFHSREQLGDELLDDSGQQHEALAAAVFGQRDDARQRARRLHDGEAGIAAERILAGEAHDEIQALVLDARKRPRRIEAERRQHRLDFALEILLEPVGGCRVPGGARQQFDALMPQRRQQHVVETGVLRIHQTARAFVDRLQLFGDGQAVGARLIRAEFEALLEAGDADLEEFVEIVRGDAQELEPLEQRDLLVERLREHALVEFEQRQLAIDVVLGGAEIGLVHGAAIWFRAIRPQRRPD